MNIEIVLVLPNLTKGKNGIIGKKCNRTERKMKPMIGEWAKKEFIITTLSDNSNKNFSFMIMKIN